MEPAAPNPAEVFGVPSLLSPRTKTRLTGSQSQRSRTAMSGTLLAGKGIYGGATGLSAPNPARLKVQPSQPMSKLRPYMYASTVRK